VVFGSSSAPSPDPSHKGLRKPLLDSDRKNVSPPVSVRRGIKGGGEEAMGGC